MKKYEWRRKPLTCVSVTAAVGVSCVEISRTGDVIEFTFESELTDDQKRRLHAFIKALREGEIVGV